MQIDIETLTENKLDEADEVLRSAFHSARSMKTDLRRLLQIEPKGFLIAYYKGLPAGTVGAVDYGVFAYLGMMAVSRRAQHRGIGRALLEELLSKLEARDLPMVLLDATEAGKPLYVRAGFDETDQVRVFKRVAHRPLTPQPESVRPMTPEDLPGVISFDAPIFGAPREKVLETYLAEYSGRAFLYHHKDGALGGYLIAQDQRIGPWTATDGAAAEALLAAGLSLAFELTPTVLIPTSNRAGATLLVKHGFVLDQSLTHMRRGGEACPARRTQIYGQASFAIG